MAGGLVSSNLCKSVASGAMPVVATLHGAIEQSEGFGHILWISRDIQRNSWKRRNDFCNRELLGVRGFRIQGDEGKVRIC